MRILTTFVFILCSYVFMSGNIYGQQGVIKGRIYNESNNEPVAFANIVIWGTNIGSVSDLDGNFVFTGIEPGFVSLAASSVGFENFISEEFQVTNAKTFYIDIGLKETSIELEDVVIKASPFKKVEESPVSLRTLGISDIEKNPGANRDISKVIQSLPGVASSVSFRNDVIVRGGGPSENSFYLDGIEIPTLNHFSTQGASGGPVGIINVDFIREVDFYSSAFPSSRGNTLSSVIEMKQIDGNKDKINTKWTLGASDLAFAAEGPAGEKTSFVFSLRRSYLQFLFDIIGLPFLPTYNDIQFKFKKRFDLKNELSIIGLGALDQFELNTGLENPTEDQQYILSFLPVNEQYSYTVGAVYKHYRDKGYSTWVLSRNYLYNRSFKYLDNDESSEDNKTLDYTSEESENKFRYENLIRTGPYKIAFGAGGAFAQYTNNTYQKVFIADSLSIVDYDSELNVAKWNIFGQLSRNMLNKRLILSFGLRMDANNYSNSMSNMLDQFSPRLSASYVLTEKLSLSFNIGRYFQHPAYTTLGFRNNAGVLLNKENNLKYIVSDHVVTGLEWNPNEYSKITLEGFYKWYSNYPFSVNDSISLANKGADFGVIGNEEVRSISEGRAFGFEVLARDKMFRGFNIIVSYTYVRSEFLNYKDEFYPSKWDNRHLLNATITKSFKNNWDVGAKWRFVGGAPYTPYDVEKSSNVLAWNVQAMAYLDYSRFNSLRLSNFHQLDIRVDKQFYFSKWSLLFYLDIQNIYNFKAKGQDILTNFDENGAPVIINPLDPIEDQKYQLRKIESESGTVLPTLGVIIEI